MGPLVSIAGVVAPPIVGAAFSRLSGRIKRLSAVQKAFETGQPHSSKAVNRALDDLRAVMGGGTGGYTTDVEKLFQDLTNSGLIYKMAEAAILYPPHYDQHEKRFKYDQILPGLEATFVHVFNQYISNSKIEIHGKGLSASDVFTRIMVALSASIWAAQQEDAEAFLREAERKALVLELRTIDKILNKKFSRGQDEREQQEFIAPRLLKASEARRIATELAKSLIPTYEVVQLHGPRGRIEHGVLLDDIYVPLPIKSTTFPRKQYSLVEMNPSFRSANDFQNAFYKAVLLGDPGGGKSTFAQKLCLDLCRNCVDKDGPLPIRIVIRDYEAAVVRDPQLALISFITKSLAQESNYPDEKEIRDSLFYLLNLGLAVTVFDGLDEITELGNRNKFVEQTERFSRQFPLCPILVTSRIVGYDKVPLPNNFDHYELGNLSPKQSEAYFSKISVIQFGVSKDKADEDARDFMAKTGKSAPDLTLNPLLLVLMCWLYQQRQGEMPENRALIYKECSLLMFMRWDELRRVDVDMPEDHDLVRLVIRLAGEIYRNQELHAGVTREWLFSRTNAYFLEQFELDKERRARQQAEKFIEFITGRAWVLTEKGRDVFTFTHRTFLEYFFARELIERHETLEKMFEELKPRILNGQWNVPSHLAIQEKIHQNTGLTEQTAKNITSIFENDTNPDNSEQVLQFTVQAIDYLVTTEKTLGELTVQFSKFALKSPNALRYLKALIRTSNDKPEIIFHSYWETFNEALSPAFGGLVGPSADWILALKVAGERDTGVLQQERFGRAPMFFERMEAVLASKDVDRDFGNAGHMKVRFDLTGHCPKECGNFGPRVWVSSVSLLGRGHWILFDLSRALLSLAKEIENTGDDQSRNYAEFALSAAPAILDQASTLLPRSDWYVEPEDKIELMAVLETVFGGGEAEAFGGLMLALALAEIEFLFGRGHQPEGIKQQILAKFCSSGHAYETEEQKKLETIVSGETPLFMLGGIRSTQSRSITALALIQESVIDADGNAPSLGETD